MTVLTVVVLRSIVTATLVLVLGGLLRRQSAAIRHWVFTGGIAATVAVIPLSFVAPTWSVIPSLAAGVTAVQQSAEMNRVAESAGAQTALGAEGLDAASAAKLPAILTPSSLIAIWVIGALAGLAILGVRLQRLSRLTARAALVDSGDWRVLADETMREHGISGPVSLRRTADAPIVATWGVRQPVILIPSRADAWPPSWARTVLRHELAHVRRRDWAFQMCAEVVRAVLWFNPAIHPLCSRLRRESEHACDDLVLQLGVSVDAYATHLVDIARACRGVSTPLPAMPAAGPSTLERRVTMLLQKGRDRRLPPLWAVSLIVAGLIVVSALVASLGVSAQSTPGRLVGHVYDTSGAVLPGVEVVLESAQQAKWPTTTDSTGRFEFTPVGAGPYTLRISVPGFRTLTDRFELGPMSNWNRQITLQVGELEETVTVTARRPAPRPASATTSAPAPVRIGGNIKPPVRLTNVPPVYPPAMRDAGLEGIVPIEALIGLDGSVASVRVLSAQVHPEFARAAEEAVRQWRYSQTLLNGVPVEVQMTVSVRFGLTD